MLDFGYVIPGQVLTGVLNVANSGSVPLSLSVNTKCLAGTGTAALRFSSLFNHNVQVPLFIGGGVDFGVSRILVEFLKLL